MKVELFPTAKKLLNYNTKRNVAKFKLRSLLKEQSEAAAERDRQKEKGLYRIGGCADHGVKWT
jgi:hypothetical protein